LLREGLARRRELFGEDHPSTVGALANLALLLKKQGKLEEAEPLYRDVLARRRALFGDAHSSTLTSILNLAVLLQARGRFAEARDLLLELERGFAAGAKSPTFDLGKARRNLVALYEAWEAAEPGAGHAQAAAEWRARLESPAQ
jgi:tetratricopeptide (TPR) repeat protein